MKGSASHSMTMVASGVLLVDDQAREVLFPRFFESTEVVLACCSRVFFGVGCDSGGVMKNIAWQNNFCSINCEEMGILDGPVRSCSKTQSTDGSCATHSPVVFLSGAWSLSFSPERMSLFARSIYSLDIKSAIHA
jgi:hypothetical protein